MKTKGISKNNIVVGAYLYTDEEIEIYKTKEREARRVLESTKKPVLKAIYQFWWDFQHS